MKILHIIDERWDSGIVHYALQTALGLKKKGHDVHIAAFSEKPAFLQAAEMGFSSLFTLKNAMYWIDLYRYASVHKFDIINAHTGASHTAAAVLKFIPSRIIRTRCDARYPVRSLGSRILISQTHRIIVPSRYMLRAYTSAFPGLPSRKISCIPQGIDTREYTALPEPDVTKGIRIGIIGRLDPVKGHRFLIEAMAAVRSKIKDVTLIIAGREAHTSVASLMEHARSLGVSEAVTCTGYVDSVIEIMKECHIGVVASIGSEAVSRAVLEWMASGRAVAATKVGGISELIEHNKSGFLVEPANPRELASAIVTLAGNEILRRKIGDEARRRVEQVFAAEICSALTEKVYFDAIEHPAY